jgi:hypothetical protein
MHGKMEDDNETYASPEDTSQAFVLRMWQEDPGEWRGTVRHVQSQVQLGFTHVEQASRFIRQYTIGEGKRQAEPSPKLHTSFHFDLGLSRRTARMLAVAIALILLSVVGVLAAGHGNLPQVLGFGH